VTYFTDQHRPLKKSGGTNSHFQASRASQTMGCLLLYAIYWVQSFIMLCRCMYNITSTSRDLTQHLSTSKHLLVVSHFPKETAVNKLCNQSSTSTIIRPHRSRSAAAYSRQTFRWTICRSVRPCVGRCVCPVHCGTTADRIRM